MSPSIAPIPAAPARKVIAWGLVRALASTAALVALYFYVPMDGLRFIPLGFTFAVAVVLLITIGAWQVRAIATSPHPRLRGIESLAVTVPLYILLFAVTYYGMATQDPSSFNADGLTRVDTLYFAVTIFSSVGFGDIFAASQTARALVTIQMILNLLVLGAGIRVFVGAARRRRDIDAADTASSGSAGE